MTAAKKSADCPIGHPIVPSPILTQHQLNNFAPALKCGCFVYFTEFAQPGLWPLFRHLALSNIADLSLTLIRVIALSEFKCATDQDHPFPNPFASIRLESRRNRSGESLGLLLHCGGRRRTTTA